MKIYVSGSIARDLIMDFPGRFKDHIDPKKIHILNLSFAVHNLKESLGGTAANICYNLAMLGEHPHLLGAVGEDQKNLVNHFAKLGIVTRHIRISKFRTAGAYIITDLDDNQIAGFHVGAMAEPVALPSKTDFSDWAIVAAENPRNMVRLARFYQKRKVNYIFDPGQQITALSKRDLAEAIRGAKVLIGNDYEIGLVAKLTPSLVSPSLAEGEKGGGDFSPMTRLERSRKVRGRREGGRLVVVRTFGPKGSEIFCDGKKIKIGIAKPRRVLDPTGAGDAYRAGLLKGLILGYNLKACGQLGATAASFAVEEYGTQKHWFTWKAVLRRHSRYFGQILL